VNSFSRLCARIADSRKFQNAIVGVIIVNAVVLGLQTYPNVEEEFGEVMRTIDGVCLGIFCVELFIRIAAFGRRPQDFFKNGWNVFDFVVIGAVFLPGVRENVAVLRLVRLLRVVRLAALLPDLRIFVVAIVRSIPAVATLAVMTVLLLFVYGMIGWVLFEEELPDRWGTIGRAMLTLFTMLTIEGWPDQLYAGMDVHPASWIFFVSFILIAGFLLINIFLAVVINSIEEARDLHKQAEHEERLRILGDGVETPEDDEAAVLEAILEIRGQLDALELRFKRIGS
jgi:voltage-gated sodium channel